MAVPSGVDRAGRNVGDQSHGVGLPKRKSRSLAALGMTIVARGEDPTCKNP
jgi:hypothetical protein